MTLPMSVLGIDLGKNWFHLVGMDREGNVVFRKRLNRAQLDAFAASRRRVVLRWNHALARSSGAGVSPRRGMTCESFRLSS
jgi:hypothetical protein